LKGFCALENKLVDEEFICIFKLSAEVCVLLSEDELGLEDGGIEDVEERGRCGSCRSSLPLAEMERTDIRKPCVGKQEELSRLSDVLTFLFFCSFSNSCNDLNKRLLTQFGLFAYGIKIGPSCNLSHRYACAFLSISSTHLRNSVGASTILITGRTICLEK
jgi:hypothetical protein